MSFPLEKYRYYTADRKVVAVSTYCGKTVRGVAVCAPEDEFDLEVGKRIAAAKCNAKVAEKRLARAQDKAFDAGLATLKAQGHQREMQAYYDDSYKAYMEAIDEYNKLIASIAKD